MDDYLELTFDIFDETGQRASVRPSLRVAQLIDAVLSEFSDLEAGDPAAYALSLAGSPVPLDPHASLIDQGIQSGDRLVFGWAQKAHASPRHPLSQPGKVALKEAGSGRLFPITWQPARIGRPDTGEHNELLAVDLSWLPSAVSVSRQHAQVIEREGVYFLEVLAAHNVTRLNGRPLAQGSATRLANGDRIELGQGGVVLILMGL